MNTSKKKNLILIDTSYTLFHRYFATLKWLSLAHPLIYKENINNKDYNWLENTLFIEKYEKLFLEGIIKLMGRKIYKNSIIIFCMDTPKEQVWRTTDIKVDYKGTRLDLNKKTNFMPTFKYTYNVIIPHILKNNNNIYKLRINKLEADDIIGIICKYLENTHLNIYILSGDEDFLQLGKSNLFFINFKNKKPLELSSNEAIMALHKKLLLGDKSDNITTIFPPRFSHELKNKLLESLELFNVFIKLNPLIEEKYIENSKLINFDRIPDKFKKEIINEFNKLDINY
jgi:5'-3' exonuclease